MVTWLSQNKRVVEKRSMWKSCNKYHNQINYIVDAVNTCYLNSMEDLYVVDYFIIFNDTRESLRKM